MIFSIPMNDMDKCNKVGEKLKIKYKKPSNNLIADGHTYLEVVENKVTF